MKQKTAIRQLIEFIDKEQGMFKDIVVIEIKRKAQELEPVNEQHIIDAFQANKNWSYAKDKGHIYFNETFEKP